MQDLTDARSDPVKVGPGTLVRPHSASDFPFNKVQALEVLKHAADTGFFISKEMAGAIHKQFASQNVWEFPPMQFAYGSSLHGWGWLDEDGWYGGYDTQAQAYDACYASRIGWAE
jgi:hypothetical protein